MFFCIVSKSAFIQHGLHDVHGLDLEREMLDYSLFHHSLRIRHAFQEYFGHLTVSPISLPRTYPAAENPAAFRGAPSLLTFYPDVRTNILSGMREDRFMSRF